jgi:Zn-dependent protease
MSSNLSLVQQIVVWVIPVLLAITLHEAAHAWVANRCGDTTAKNLGRLSMNPLKHVDLFGTVLVPLLVGLLSQFQFIFGWAKPVPIEWNRLRHPRRDMAWVTLAGPCINLLMAVLWTACLKISLYLHPQTNLSALFLFLMAQAGIVVNLILAFLNLIPVPPLDGSRILASMLPPKAAENYLKIEPFGFLILIALLFTGALSWLLRPLLYASLHLLQNLFSL